MDANTPINIPIRLEQWIHDNYMEVETIIIDARPILDATDFDNLPEWEDWGADFIAEDAQRIGLLKMWSGPFTVELFNCDEYPDYLEWRKTHKTVEGAAEHILDLSKKELLRRIEETKKQLDKYVSQYEALSGENPRQTSGTALVDDYSSNIREKRRETNGIQKYPGQLDYPPSPRNLIQSGRQI